MCGITGVVSRKGLASHVGALTAANRIVRHRGPDGEGFAVFDVERACCRYLSHHGEPPSAGALDGASIAFGHRRLAIIDLSDAGLQPMANEDGSVWVSFNGEIYNYVELRRELEAAGHAFRSDCDTEVIVHAYEQWGDDCVQRFVGMWAFALLDLSRRRLLCSRDRFGIKPLYYAAADGEFAFASEIKQLLELSFVPREIDHGTVFDYLANEASDVGERTFFRGVWRLLPGHNLVLDLTGGEPRSVRYYLPPLAIDDEASPDAAAERFGELLREAVAMHLRSDVDVGSCLSGGLDSSAIVCIMADLLRGSGSAQHVFSSTFDEEEANELPFARAVAEQTRTRWHVVRPDPQHLLRDLDCIVWHQDEPIGSTSAFAQWSVFRLIHDSGVKVVLDGQGADEQLGGYVSYTGTFMLDLARKRRYLRLLREARRHGQLQGRDWRQVLPGLFGDLVRRGTGYRPPPASAADAQWLEPGLHAAHGGESAYAASLSAAPYGDREPLANALYRATFLNNLPGLLRLEDRDSMAFSVESRVPFLDHRVVEFSLSLPATLRIRDGYTKRVLRDAMRGVIPDEVRTRARKLGFATPEARWQRGPLRSAIIDALHDPALRPYVRADQALAHLARLEAEQRLDFAPWRWLNLARWMRVYAVA